MTTVEDTAAVEAETPKKSSKKGLLIGLFLALLLGGGGFFRNLFLACLVVKAPVTQKPRWNIPLQRFPMFRLWNLILW